VVCSERRVCVVSVCRVGGVDVVCVWCVVNVFCVWCQVFKFFYS
jgi:hypothetical protein